MRAGSIGTIAIGGVAAAALTWTYLARPDPEPSGPAAAPSDRPDIAVPRDAPGRPMPPPGAGAEPMTPGAAATPSGADRPAPTSEPDQLAAFSPGATPAAPPPGTSAQGAAATPEEPHGAARAPSFDIVRIDADGQAVIAGRTAPDGRVEVLLDGAVVETILADAGGRFVAVLDVGTSSQARELRLRITLPEPPQPPTLRAGTEAPHGRALGQSVSVIASGSAPGPVSMSAPGAVSGAGPPTGGASGPLPETEHPRGRAIEPAAADRSADGQIVAPADADPRPAAGAALASADDATLPGPPDATPHPMARTAAADPAENVPIVSDPVIILPPQHGRDAPALVQAQDDELAMLQVGGAAPSRVVLDQLTQQPDGGLLLRGRARPGHSVRIYGNNRAIETVAVADGSWSLALPGPLAEEIRLFRLDEIARSGEVASRIEVPFQPSSAVSEPLSQVVRDRRITVQRGDNLWRIAEQHYGEGIRYSLIFGANSDLIRDPDLIYPDQVFTVPELVEAQ